MRPSRLVTVADTFEDAIEALVLSDTLGVSVLERCLAGTMQVFVDGKRVDPERVAQALRERWRKDD